MPGSVPKQSGERQGKIVLHMGSGCLKCHPCQFPVYCHVFPPDDSKMRNTVIQSHPESKAPTTKGRRTKGRKELFQFLCLCIYLVIYFEFHSIVNVDTGWNVFGATYLPRPARKCIMMSFRIALVLFPHFSTGRGACTKPCLYPCPQRKAV